MEAATLDLASYTLGSLGGLLLQEERTDLETQRVDVVGDLLCQEVSLPHTSTCTQTIDFTLASSEGQVSERLEPPRIADLYRLCEFIHEVSHRDQPIRPVRFGVPDCLDDILLTASL